MPSQQIVPEHVGLKALYGLQQIVVQPLQQRWKKNTADAWLLDMASTPRVNRVTVSSFFIVGWVGS